MMKETTYIAGWSTAPAIVAASVATPVSSIPAPFHWNAVRAGHIGCFCTLRKEESKDGLRVRKKPNDQKHRLGQPEDLGLAGGTRSSSGDLKNTPWF